ncbi:MAG: hypothetical protein CMA63_08535 [Euryarchaeota archaeon]|nr:hypothetical protein [Euryarchaeota archaeon]|tara:strand:- start:8116 stop:8436 length:321 start_codon:yes stop_codon:yes gene_type:complete
MASRISQRIAALDQPDDVTDEEEIWALIRLSLVVVRVVVFISIILVSEMMEEYSMYELSISIWSLIIGIPLFIMLSISIIIGDRMVKKGDSSPQKTALLHPILERV